MVSGCCGVPDKAYKSARENALLFDKYTEIMRDGLTAQEQDQKFIEAARRRAHAFNFALNEDPLPEDVASWYQENEDN